MKVGVYLVSKNPPTLGGGFSYQERLIEAIDAFSFDPSLEVCFVGRIPSEKIKLKKQYVRIASWSFYRLFVLLDKFGFIRFLSRVTFSNLNFASRSDHEALRHAGVDILLYPKQSFLEVDDFPFISMNWDIGHRSSYTFPEFIGGDNFVFRENWYNVKLQKAFAVFAESEHGKRELAELCRIPEFKIHVIPMFPGRVIDLQVSDEKQSSILQQYNLSPQQYFYYPAQYWAHKNHYNLLKAFKRIRQNADVKLVFSGADYGNKPYIESLVRELQLTGDVRMLGFISNEEVFTFYKNSIALVMPSFLGPTNMPLLEAQALGAAVICTDFDGHREQCGDGALYVKPENADSIAAAMIQVLNTTFRKELIMKANAQRARSIFTIGHALISLNAAFVSLSNIRKTFWNS